MVYLWVSSQLLNVRGGSFVHSQCLGGELGKGWISGAGACVFIFAESSSMQETFQIEWGLSLSPVSNPQLSHMIPGHRADTFSPYGHQPHGHGRGLVTAGTGEAESWLGRGQLPWLALAATSPDILHSPRTETLQLVSLAWLFLLVILPGIIASQLLPYLFIWALRKTYQTWIFCWFCDSGLWPDRLNSLDPKSLVVSAPCLLMISLMPSVSGIQWLTADAWYLSSLGILSKDRQAWGCDLASFGPLLLSVSESSSPTDPLTSPSKQQLWCCCLPPPAFLMPFCQRWHLSC